MSRGPTPEPAAAPPQLEPAESVSSLVPVWEVDRFRWPAVCDALNGVDGSIRDAGRRYLRPSSRLILSGWGRPRYRLMT